MIRQWNVCNVSNLNSIKLPFSASVTPEDSDWYICTARNSAGVASAKAKLTVERKFYFIISTEYSVNESMSFFPAKPRLIEAIASTAHYASSIRETHKRRFSPDRSAAESVESVSLRHVSKHPRSSPVTGFSSPQPFAAPPPDSPPQFSSQLTSVQCEEGQRAHFECIANTAGRSDVAIEWFKDGQPLRLSKLLNPKT